ncbi:hypothetical protein ACFL6O_02930, partial [candidate division KSB1 bacterium]
MKKYTSKFIRTSQLPGVDILFHGDGLWVDKRKLYIFMEQKTIFEYNEANGWFGEKGLLGQRKIITRKYKQENLDVAKCMIIIAQLRDNILKQRIDQTFIDRTKYRSAFAIPIEILRHFRKGFNWYHKDTQLNSLSSEDSNITIKEIF